MMSKDIMDGIDSIIKECEEVLEKLETIDDGEQYEAKGNVDDLMSDETATYIINDLIETGTLPEYVQIALIKGMAALHERDKRG